MPLFNQPVNIPTSGETSQQLHRLFQQQLNTHRKTGNHIIGFTRSVYGGHDFLVLDNLLGPKFNRDFQPLLLATLTALKQNERIEKSELFAFLLHKYFNIKPDAEGRYNVDAWQVDSLPPVFRCVLDPNAEDCDLHRYFLQPFLLFNIEQDNRKFKRNHPPQSNYEWLWLADNCDAAPLFRLIIQSFILSELLEELAQAQSEFRSASIEPLQGALQDLHQKLLNKIAEDFSATFTTLNELVQPNLQGLFGVGGQAQVIRFMDILAPGFMDVVLLYPLGRLLFGQPGGEVHHLLATTDLDRQQNRIAYWLKYAFLWLYTHLNLTTSVFWLKSVFTIGKEVFAAFKEYVTDPRVPLANIIRRSLLIVPNMLILVSSPLLMLLPPLYGITSIPFSLLRSAFLLSRTQSLRRFALYGIDIVESLKDILLFFFIALPILGTIIAAINAHIPVSLLTLGSWAVFVPLVVGFIALEAYSGSSNNIFMDDIIELASTIAMSSYGAFLGLTTFIAFGCYFSSALLGRAVMNVMPESWRQNIEMAWTKIKAFFGVRPSVRPAAILPPPEVSSPLADIEQGMEDIPVPLRRVNVPTALQEEAETVKNRFLRLVTLHFASTEKEKFVKRINKLEITEQTTETTLRKAIQKAQDVLNNPFSEQQMGNLKSLLEQLKAQPSLPAAEADFIRKESAAMNMQQMQRSPVYRPSAWFIQQVNNKKENIPEEIVTKCNQLRWAPR